MGKITFLRFFIEYVVSTVFKRVTTGIDLNLFIVLMMFVVKYIL